MDPYERLERDLEALRQEVNRLNVNDHVLKERLQAVADDVAEVMRNGKYVPLIRYIPVERLMYGLVGLLLTGVIVGVLALLIGNGAP